MIRYQDSTSEQREYFETMIGREIYCCVSSLVSKLADFDREEYMDAFRAPWSTDRMVEELESLGYVWVPCIDGPEAEGYGSWESSEIFCEGYRDEATLEAFDLVSSETPYNEVCEHWAVSAWLARRLSAVGEHVVDIEGLDVWCRCTTGQSIFLDSCVWEALQDLLPEGGSNE